IQVGDRPMNQMPSFIAQFVDDPSASTSVLRALANSRRQLSRPEDAHTHDDLQRIQDAIETLQWVVDRIWVMDREVLENDPDACNWDCIKQLQGVINTLRIELWQTRVVLGLEPKPGSPTCDRWLLS
ncbi:MAG: hypothetical protein WDZ72_09970, partial [Cyclobacteriaceae bacterium]